MVPARRHGRARQLTIILVRFGWCKWARRLPDARQINLGLPTVRRESELIVKDEQHDETVLALDVNEMLRNMTHRPRRTNVTQIRGSCLWML